MKMRILAILGMAVGFVAVSPESGHTSGHTAEVKLKAAAFLPGGVYVKYFKDWVKHTNKQCTGKFKISVVGPAAVKSMEQWNALKNGVIDLHYGPPNYYKGVMPVADVMILSKNETAEQRKMALGK